MGVALAARKWTLAELHRLPEDGNKYEVIRGELFVTPAPSVEHETILARLTRILDPYVAENGLGYVYRPRAALQHKGSEAEPDLMVRQLPTGKRKTWRGAPKPILVVEVHSPYTHRRDKVQKREYYLDAGAAEYWMLDPEEKTLTQVRAGSPDVVVSDVVRWSPAGTTTPLVFRVRQLFD